MFTQNSTPPSITRSTTESTQHRVQACETTESSLNTLSPSNPIHPTEPPVPATTTAPDALQNSALLPNNMSTLNSPPTLDASILTIENSQQLEPLAGADLAFLTTMKSPYITAIATFEQALNANDFKERISERFDSIERLWLRPVKNLRGQHFWQPVTAHDFNQHVTCIDLPEGDHEQHLHTQLNTIFQQPIDLQKPLWEMYLFQSPEGPSSFLFRVHHAISDGLGLVGLLLHTMDNGSEVTIPMVAKHDAKGSDSQSNPNSTNSNSNTNMTQRLWESISNPITTLYQCGAACLSLGNECVKFISTVYDVATRAPDPRTPIKRSEPLMQNEVNWLSTPLSLAKVKAIGKATNTSVNDALMAMISGASRRYMIENDFTEADSTRLRAMIPLNLRQLDTWDDPNRMMRAGNQFSIALLPLATEVAEPTERLNAMHQRAKTLKRSYEPVLNHLINPLLPYLPQSVLSTLIKRNADQSSMLVSNVPGPTSALRMLDTEMDRIMWYMPTFENLGLAFQVISYNGNIYSGLTTDKELITDPQRLEQLLQQEYQNLVDLHAPDDKK